MFDDGPLKRWDNNEDELDKLWIFAIWTDLPDLLITRAG